MKFLRRFFYLLIGLSVLLALLLVWATQFAPARFRVNIPIQSIFGGIEADEQQLKQRLSAPPGFSVSLYAGGITNARVLRFTEAGDLLVSTPRNGEIILLERDTDGDGQADATRVLIDGLNRPHGIDFYGDWLYIAESNGFGRIRFDHQTGQTIGEYQPLVSDIPDNGNHWTRTIRIGPDHKIYLSVGSSCNVCEEPDPERATMLRYELDGSGFEIFASGLRNSVGFDWSPIDGHIYATDNGRDLLGDDFPPDELNRVEQGQFYGWPYAHGDRVADPDFGPGNSDKIERSTAPVHAFRAHNAPLGMEFLTSKHLPEQYQNIALVALHGSWNRTTKDGYKVVSLHWNSDGSVEERGFVTGFEGSGHVIGRPADVRQGPNGDIYISDDFANAIYRVSWNENRNLKEIEPTNTQLQQPIFEKSQLNLADPQVNTDYQAGKILYQQNPCAECHDSSSQATAIPLKNLANRYNLAAMQQLLKTPTPPMPSFEFTLDQRRQLATYLLLEY
ncbi:MAG: PQQ-dependent sugar dehydrogenase [Pseudomonadales bacterium]|nr:PQQ-dependent sugar dehydrogenase [Pseudomonadales bacterium]